jgi:undecaprenyl phosphate N,N'-diacetylbacillosamine 1-phosphate transferase
MYKSVIKPVGDFLAAFIILLIASPFLLVVILLLMYANKGDVFFTQPRPGKHSKIFRLIKFKTMRDAYDENGNPLPDKDRVTKIGKFIRSASLDELPQLINVLKGDMSLIGPRPLLVKYLPLYNEFQLRRHEVKPGITGWAQVNGRNAISWQQKFEYDVWYVDHISLSLDIKILIRTVKKVLVREGVNSSEEKTMTAFTGNNS